MSDIEAKFGIVVRGEPGVDGSLSDGGYTFWGTDTLSADTQWQFANVVRLRSYVEINQIKAIRFYLGRFNLTVQTVQAIANTLEGLMSLLRADQHVIDYRVMVDHLQDGRAGAAAESHHPVPPLPGSARCDGHQHRHPARHPHHRLIAA